MNSLKKNREIITRGNPRGYWYLTGDVWRNRHKGFELHIIKVIISRDKILKVNYKENKSHFTSKLNKLFTYDNI